MNDLPGFDSVGGVGTDITNSLIALRNKMRADANKPPKLAYIYMDRTMLEMADSLGYKIVDGKLVLKENPA